MISRESFSKKQILYCFSSSGEKISVKNQNIIIKDKDGLTKIQASCYRLFAIFVIGDGSITTPVIKMAKKFGFSIVIMTASFKVYEILGFRLEGNTILKKKQYANDDLDIARFIISNKIENQNYMLRRIRNKDELCKRTIKNLDVYLEDIWRKGDSLSKIMGIEGIAAKEYFSIIFEDFDWTCRKPRIKADVLNSTLDIGYTILFNYIESILSVYGFDTYVGFLHREFYMRKSLVCDIVEPFRPIIDWQIRKSINLGQFVSEDFIEINKRYVLKWKANKKYVSTFATAIDGYRDDIFLYAQGLYRSFMKGRDISEYKAFRM